VWIDGRPMSGFDPDKPVLVHDRLNNSQLVSGSVQPTNSSGTHGCNFPGSGWLGDGGKDSSENTTCSRCVGRWSSPPLLEPQDAVTGRWTELSPEAQLAQGVAQSSESQQATPLPVRLSADWAVLLSEQPLLRATTNTMADFRALAGSSASHSRLSEQTQNTEAGTYGFAARQLAANP